MKKIFAVAVATLAGVALTACSSGGCGPCGPKGNPVYQRPCCAQSGGSYMAPAPSTMTAPAMPAPAAKPAPAGGQMACGAGKCG